MPSFTLPLGSIGQPGHGLVALLDPEGLQLTRGHPAKEAREVVHFPSYLEPDQSCRQVSQLLDRAASLTLGCALKLATTCSQPPRLPVVVATGAACGPAPLSPLPLEQRHHLATGVWTARHGSSPSLASMQPCYLEHGGLQSG